MRRFVFTLLAIGWSVGGVIGADAADPALQIAPLKVTHRARTEDLKPE